MKSTFALFVVFMANLSIAAPPDSIISYQGMLRENGQPASGVYDFAFQVFSTGTGGSPLASSTNSTVGVTNGLFTAFPDFGLVFDTQAYWLGISVRTNGSGAFMTLGNRQRVAVTPKAVHSVKADQAQIAFAADVSTINTAALQDQAVTSLKIENNTIVNADIAAAAAIADTKLATISTAGKVANSATTATSSNVPNAIVARNANGDFAAGLISADDLDVPGVIRSGSESGTAQAPFLPSGGLIFRRLNSQATTSGSIVARTDSCTLVRDGSNAGLRINYTASGEKLSFNAIGLSFYGTNVNFRGTVISASAGFVQLFSNAQRVVHAQITFGDVYGDIGGHVTQVILDRFDSAAESDFYLTGTIISSYNQ